MEILKGVVKLKRNIGGNRFYTVSFSRNIFRKYHRNVIDLKPIANLQRFLRGESLNQLVLRNSNKVELQLVGNCG